MEKLEQENLHQIKAQQFYTDLDLYLTTVLISTRIIIMSLWQTVFSQIRLLL